MMTIWITKATIRGIVITHTHHHHEHIVHSHPQIAAIIMAQNVILCPPMTQKPTSVHHPVLGNREDGLAMTATRVAVDIHIIILRNPLQVTKVNKFVNFNMIHTLIYLTLQVT